ncbi:hypothetical protein [Dactylosporangium sp. CA-092794]|uniref:hypothetical protein n=1 Tax=Dactylosporangium sp. CA-092794 TaxID=3239929 RepID=UPI003D8BB63F
MVAVLAWLAPQSPGGPVVDPTRIGPVPGSTAPQPDASSVRAEPASPTPASAPRPLTKDDLNVTCSVEPAPPGAQVTLTYMITAKIEGRADLGADVYADDGTSLADGFGDLHNYPIKPGVQSVPRPLRIPAKLDHGDYEITGELWPEGKIGTGETIADPTCATFSV